MTRAVTHKRLLAAIAIGLAFVLTPMVAQAAGESSSYWEFNDYWVDQLSNEVVLTQAKALNPDQFKPYLGQLQVVRTALLRRDKQGTYIEMNDRMGRMGVPLCEYLGLEGLPRMGACKAGNPGGGGVAR